MDPDREQEQVSTRFHVNNCSEAATQSALLCEGIIYTISETRESICRAARSIILILEDEYERTLRRLERDFEHAHQCYKVTVTQASRWDINLCTSRGR